MGSEKTTRIGTAEAAELVGVSMQAVRTWYRFGRGGRKLPATRGPFGQILIDKRDLIEFVKATHPKLPAAVAGS